ncbi:MAG: phosphate butyryltransferase [Planctomycetaceae bacterium]|nr:phosphate butyryltransferase [Planctomycetaceae bacterium]
MPLPSFDELYEIAGQRAIRARVVAAGAADPTVLKALAEANLCGWIEPILVGPVHEIHSVAKAAEVDLSGMRIVDSEQLGVAAVAEVREGRADILMKGQINTPDLIRAVLNADHGLRTGRTLCQVVLMEIPTQKRRFLLSDTGLCIEPNFRQKSEILESLIAVSHSLGEALPKVAVMSATEKATTAMPDTLEAVELQRLNEAGEFRGALVQGPLSFDLAYAAEAGDKKRISGAVTGAADAMLFPNLLAANLTVKAIMYTAECRFGGVVCGATCPIVFMSRADSSTTRLNSLALALTLTVRS